MRGRFSVDCPARSARACLRERIVFCCSSSFMNCLSARENHPWKESITRRTLNSVFLAQLHEGREQFLVARITKHTHAALLARPPHTPCVMNKPRNRGRERPHQNLLLNPATSLYTASRLQLHSAPHNPRRRYQHLQSTLLKLLDGSAPLREGRFHRQRGMRAFRELLVEALHHFRGLQTRLAEHDQRQFDLRLPALQSISQQFREALSLLRVFAPENRIVERPIQCLDGRYVDLHRVLKQGSGLRSEIGRDGGRDDDFLG